MAKINLLSFHGTSTKAKKAFKSLKSKKGIKVNGPYIVRSDKGVQKVESKKSEKEE